MSSQYVYIYDVCMQAEVLAPLNQKWKFYMEILSECGGFLQCANIMYIPNDAERVARTPSQWAFVWPTDQNVSQMLNGVCGGSHRADPDLRNA